MMNTSPETVLSESTETLARVLASLADSTRDGTPVTLDYVRRALQPPRIAVREGIVYAPVEAQLSGWRMLHESTAMVWCYERDGLETHLAIPCEPQGSTPENTRSACASIALLADCLGLERAIETWVMTGDVHT